MTKDIHYKACHDQSIWISKVWLSKKRKQGRKQNNITIVKSLLRDIYIPHHSHYPPILFSQYPQDQHYTDGLSIPLLNVVPLWYFSFLHALSDHQLDMNPFVDVLPSFLPIGPRPVVAVVS